ncbi:hypothetical protein STEG23_023986, partial [Scotinomys teguina]
TPLHYACSNNKPQMVQFLLSKNASIDIKDDEGCTPVIKATQRNNVECLHILLVNGADTQIKDVDGNTALHHAASRGNMTCAKKLLSFQANIQAKNVRRLTPYKIAIINGKEEMAWLLRTSKHSTCHHEETSSKKKKQKTKKKKHVKFNCAVHYSTDPTPFCSGVRPSRPLKSILKTPIPVPPSSTVLEPVQQRKSLWLSEHEERSSQITPDKDFLFATLDRELLGGTMKKLKTHLNLSTLTEAEERSTNMCSIKHPDGTSSTTY